MWQHQMDRILSGVKGALCYMDDVLVVEKTQAEHNEGLTIVLQRLEKAALKLKPEKCEFNKTEVEYLGHAISNKGIHLSEKGVCDPRGSRAY